jgi:uncharacterized protein (TIGR03437 family)
MRFGPVLCCSTPQFGSLLVVSCILLSCATAAMAAPSLSSLSPPYAAAGGAAFTLYVNGSGFVSGSLVQWNGATLTTTFMNSAQVSAQVEAFRIATQGTATVTVINPDSTLSGGLTFTINASSAPYLTVYEGPAPTVGGPGFTLVIDGSGFVSGAVAQWSGLALSTTFISSTQVSAQVPASDIASAASYTITVVNPGGGVSNGLPISVLPELDSVTPSSIPAGSAAFTVTVTGRGFPSNSLIQWNSVPLPTTFVSSTQLAATVAASQVLAPARVMLTISYPGIPTSNGIVFNVSAPSITTVSPSTAVAGGPGFTLTVTGSNFVSGSQVQWNTQALATTFISGTQLMAQVPASMIANAGNAMVAVGNNVYTVSNSVNFTVANSIVTSLVLTSISPASVPAGGLAFTMTVIGSGFLSSSTVQCSGTPLPTTYVTANQLTATVPASLITSAGTAMITVVNPGGSASNPLSLTITVATASLSSISPNSATAGSPAFTLTVSGSGFANTSTVDWNGSPLSTSFVNVNQLTASVTAGMILGAGTASVTVVNAGVTVSNALAFIINAALPSVSRLSPTSASAGGPAFTLTVNGSGFLSGSAVEWNGSLLSTSYVSGDQLTASVPASLIANAGSASITVANPGATLSNAFTFTINTAGPLISSMYPNSATAGGPAFTLTLNGSGFVNGSTAEWSGSALTTNYMSGNQLTASVPASLIANAGSASVAVVNPGGAQSGSLPFAINPATPSVSSLSPSSATTGGGGFTLTVIGSGFLIGSFVQWNGSALTTSYMNANQLTASVPANLIANAGNASVSVLNPGGASSSALPFTITAATPSLSSLAPNSATAGGGGLTLTVNGSGFLNGSAVEWNGSPLTTSYVDASRLTASVAAASIASVGTANVVVVNPGGIQSNALTFTIVAAGSSSLSITSASPLPPGTVGIPYSESLSATGGATPYKSWTVVDENHLAPGIALAPSNGNASALLTGTPTAVGSFAFTVQVTDNANATATAELSLTINAGAVSISAGEIVNAASYTGGSIAPGEIVTIFGSRLGPDVLAGLQLDSRGRVSTLLSGTQVLFDGLAAPLIYAQAGQVSAIVPYELAGKSATQVQVVQQGQSSNVVSMPVSAAMPGIFTLDASGHGPGAILNQDGTVNSPDSPASAGTYLLVYATGEGNTSPAGVDGAPDDWPAPVPVTQPVSATIDGTPVTVQYAGGAPGQVAGLLQVNIQVPEGTRAGSSVPIAISVGGQNSQANVTVAIK